MPPGLMLDTNLRRVDARLVAVVATSSRMSRSDQVLQLWGARHAACV